MQNVAKLSMTFSKSGCELDLKTGDIPKTFIIEALGNARKALATQIVEEAQDEVGDDVDIEAYLDATIAIDREILNNKL